VQAQQPEQPRRLNAELPVRPGEHGRDAGSRVTGIQGVQAVCGIPQFGG
jgi:hypothetical protein